MHNRIFSIEDKAFEYCDFTDIIIPDSVKSIGKYTFQYCRKLKTITISDNVEYIGKDAFYDCDNITKVMIKNDSYNKKNTKLIKECFSEFPIEESD